MAKIKEGEQDELRRRDIIRSLICDCSERVLLNGTVAS